MAKIRFEWDAEKNGLNREKHGVSFVAAQYAFADPQRIIAKDESHSQTEERFYCFGEVNGGILTVRFTYRSSVIRILALVTGAKERPFMSAKIKYTNEPLGDVKVIADFLPSPAELAFNEEGVKVTLALSKKSIDFFKAEAAKNHTQYQRMIRRLLDAYVESHNSNVMTK
jgi:uncharacterized DUF497 family protein/predicted DNA binding CopG/RHH family protein